MNFLELVSRTMEKCSITGTITTVAGQTGERLRVVNWVNEAWLDIQLLNMDWAWMRDDFTALTVVGELAYSPVVCGISSFRKWHLDTLRLYKNSVGLSDDQPIEFTPYGDFRATYMTGVQTNDRPSTFTVRARDNSILLGRRPDAIYTLYGEYQRAASQLAADGDIPGLPADYHMAIVHGARVKYGNYEAAAEVIGEATRDYDRLVTALTNNQVQDVTFGDPFA